MKDIIANRRKELGLTQQQLAEKLNVSDKVVSKWETGRSLPDTAMLQDLANALEFSVSDLFTANTDAQTSMKTTSAKDSEIKFQNLFIITMTIQIIAALLITIGRILFQKYHYYGLEQYGVVCHVLIILGFLAELVAAAYYLVSRNNLLDKYPNATPIDKKYVNRLLLFTYFIVFFVLAIFIATHGLSDGEQLLLLLLLAPLFLLPFLLCYFWNKNRNS